MRLAKREVTDTEALRAIIDACKTVRLGLADDDGIFIVPVNFGYTWDVPAQDPRVPSGIASMSTRPGAVTARPAAAPHLTLWIHSATEGRKAAALAAASAAATPVAIETGYRRRPDTRFVCVRLFIRVSLDHGHRHRVCCYQPFRKWQGLERIMEHLAPGEEAAYAPGSDRTRCRLAHRCDLVHRQAT